MQIVIKISDTLKEIIDSDDIKTASHPMWVAIMMDAIKNGTPLPKGHGRLIDADRTALLYDLFCYTKYTGIDEAPYEDATKALAFAPTIIEADKEGSESE